MLRAALIGIPIGITFVDCFGYVAKVEGVSMQPSLNPDNSGKSDFVFLSRWYSRAFRIDRGDIVSLISPKEPDQKLIKRVIALEGDLVKTIGYKRKYLRVPEGHCWVEGDHKGHSLDSNLLGPIAVGLITAKASHIVWPPPRWQRLNSHLPEDRIPINLLSIAGKRTEPEEFQEILEVED
ncbi:mitochondrial inner membrane protease subunit 2 isoform X1 [Oratosquilla oratoria]|uniref:mitochondrial inner membrane protease subunit 2 isoform X1 n=1 Tax=Oratosquilla oratoria TaxID=337810 RepID=UPI003F7650CD